jgi:hypothetical protein
MHIETVFSLVLAIGIISTVGTAIYNNNNLAFAEEEFKEWSGTDHGDSNPSEKNCEKQKTLRDYAKAVDHMKCDDDNIDWSDFKSSSVYISATDEQQDCLRAADDLGGSLTDYEVMDCYKEPEEMLEKTGND